MLQKENINVNNKPDLVKKTDEATICLTKKETIDLLQKLDGIKRMLKIKLQTV